jgi:steroid 5-alpha reductase family enzyme
MEVPVLIAVAVFSFVNNDRLTVPLITLATLFCAHYIHRSIIFPLRLRTLGKKMPVVIMASAIVFNMVNGFFIGYFFRNYAHYELSWLEDKRFLLGIFFFVAGAIINLKSDTTLIRLRGTGETGYKIPEGFLFDKVSCPNHLGEILEWMGFAVMCWNLPALGFFIWTVANLVPRSLAHHQWYREKFANYPASRRAIIPYLL